jgi:hypothetical protein
MFQKKNGSHIVKNGPVNTNPTTLEMKASLTAFGNFSVPDSIVAKVKEILSSIENFSMSDDVRLKEAFREAMKEKSSETSTNEIENEND